MCSENMQSHAVTKNVILGGSHDVGRGMEIIFQHLSLFLMDRAGANLTDLFSGSTSITSSLLPHH